MRHHDSRLSRTCRLNSATLFSARSEYDSVELTVSDAFEISCR